MMAQPTIARKHTDPQRRERKKMYTYSFIYMYKYKYIYYTVSYYIVCFCLLLMQPLLLLLLSLPLSSQHFFQQFDSMVCIRVDHQYAFFSLIFYGGHWFGILYFFTLRIQRDVYPYRNNLIFFFKKNHSPKFQGSKIHMQIV